MTLWNVIRDFFVQYVFGGWTSRGDLYGSNLIGNLYVFNEDYGGFGSGLENTGEGLMFKLENTYSGSYGLNVFDVNYISFGDWLSTTATIITLVGLFIAITMLIISLFKWIVRLVSLRG